jgi:uncharacterized protein YigA (DUF484 family)
MNITQEQAAHYLREHPDFFMHQNELLIHLSLPGVHGGQIVSLAERQTQVIREKAAKLESRLHELIQYAEENEAISDKIHATSLALQRARSIDAVLQALYQELSDRYNIPHSAMRLWGTTLTPDLPEFLSASLSVHELADTLHKPRCSAGIPADIRAWFDEPGEHLRSFAVLPLREGDLCGMLVLASEDARRFYPEMGTLYLSRIAAQIGAALYRYL